MTNNAMLEYYRASRFNPAYIELADERQLAAHFEKRWNLYERHLGIPIGMFRGRRVLEFGCNSGENSLALAAVGARMTLVEPHEAVHERLHALYAQHMLYDRIDALYAQTIDEFAAEEVYDAVIAEGFLWTLPNRETALVKMVSLLAPGGVAVTSFNDRYGCFVEMLRRLLFWRACELQHIDRVDKSTAGHIVERLFGREFRRLQSSRDLWTWCYDSLVNPVFCTFWSYPEILSAISAAGCEVHSMSPKWCGLDQYCWYKNVQRPSQRRHELLEQWRRSFAYFITGNAGMVQDRTPVPHGVLEEIELFIEQSTRYSTVRDLKLGEIAVPYRLFDFLATRPVVGARRIAAALSETFAAATASTFSNLAARYDATPRIHDTWGVPYHYISFTRRLNSRSFNAA